MAEVVGSGNIVSQGHYRHVWTGLANGDTGRPVSAMTVGDLSVQVTGTFSTGGTVLLEGSNDGGATWAGLNDPQGSPISLTDNSIVTVLEYVEQIRPRVSAGDGSTLLNVHLVGRKPV